VADCWLVSALASAAEFPHFVRELFETQTAQESGEYTVLIADNGMMNSVQVNDLVPCRSIKGKYYPLFLMPHDASMWAALYEKAVAKHKGGYGYLDGGFSQTAYTMMGSESYNELCKDGKAWVDKEYNEVNIEEELESYMTLDYMVTATTNPDSFEKTGLYDAHAYSVLKIARLTFAADVDQTAPVVLVKLRNPWGRQEWTGDWSDSSDKWLKYDMAEKLNYVRRRDGVFWMSIEDFLKHFAMITVNCTILKTTCAKSKQRIVTEINIKRHK
jgi:calpain-15